MAQQSTLKEMLSDVKTAFYIATENGIYAIKDAATGKFESAKEKLDANLAFLLMATLYSTDGRKGFEIPQKLIHKFSESSYFNNLLARQVSPLKKEEDKQKYN